MPEITDKNRHWPRGGQMNQKRHLGITEEEKADMSSCRGQKDGHVCKNPVYRCSNCGNWGCAQEVADKCTEQGFKNDKCLNCGETGTRVPLSEEEYTALRED